MFPDDAPVEEPVETVTPPLLPLVLLPVSSDTAPLAPDAPALPDLISTLPLYPSVLAPDVA
jgi:hypothetical protein